MSEKKKSHGNKLRYDLLSAKALTETVACLTAGAERYSDYGYRDLQDADSMYYAAAMRHIMAWRLGIKDDSDDGLPHLAHAAACLFILMDLDNPQGEEGHVCPLRQTMLKKFNSGIR